jgi:hypothetical protein
LIEFLSLGQQAVYVIPVVFNDNLRSTQFTIELNPTQNPDIGIIQLRAGHYEVNVYRQTGQTLDPASELVDGLIFATEAYVEIADGEDCPVTYKRTFEKAVYYEQ